MEDKMIVGYPVRIVEDKDRGSCNVGDGVSIHFISVALVLPEDETPDNEQTQPVLK